MPPKNARRKKQIREKKQNPKPVFSSAGFSLLRGIFDDVAGHAWDELCRTDLRDVMAYQRLWENVLAKQEFIRHPRVGSGLQDYWLERFLEDPNPFHRKAELTPSDGITPSLAREYGDELKQFMSLLRFDLEPEVLRLNNSMGLFTPTFKDMKGLPLMEPPPTWMEPRTKIKKRILTGEISGLVREIADYFYKTGFGLFGRARAFRWDSQGKNLIGVDSVDPIRLENLVGYDEQRKPLLENIEAFVSGKIANNVLIYGERGTGKSSTVKALLNDYQERGLRVVEVTPADLMDYHELLAGVRGRRERFVLFVDDLSFEEGETSYKGLKALLEGTVESTPENVILIATSNRRHLVREFFSEREEGERKDGEVHGQDTVEEKLSLADRFGLVLSFYSPNQEIYLKIVESWAKEEGIKIRVPELHAKALLWARQNNGPSGRSARQFINDLKGKT